MLRRCGGADRVKVGTLIGKWLSGSRDRNGKRLQRARNGAAEDVAPAGTAQPAAEDGIPAGTVQPAAALSPAVTAADEQQQDDGVAAVLGLAALQEEEELPLHMF